MSATVTASIVQHNQCTSTLFFTRGKMQNSNHLYLI